MISSITNLQKKKRTGGGAVGGNLQTETELAKGSVWMMFRSLCELTKLTDC